MSLGWRRLAALLLLAAATPRAASPSAPKAGGEVDWKAQVLRASGSGPPDLKAANPAQARLAAEKAAQLDAFRNLLATAKELPVSSDRRLADLLGKSDPLESKVEGALRDFRVAKKRYYSDNGVELDVEVPLAALVALLPAPAGPTGKIADALGRSGAHTSLVVDASGLDVTPALTPRIMDSQGGLVFGEEMMDSEARGEGVAHYVGSVDEAKRSRWAGNRPLVVKASEVRGADLVLADADAENATQGGLAHLRAGRVLIVIR